MIIFPVPEISFLIWDCSSLAMHQAVSSISDLWVSFGSFLIHIWNQFSYQSQCRRPLQESRDAKMEVMEQRVGSSPKEWGTPKRDKRFISVTADLLVCFVNYHWDFEMLSHSNEFYQVTWPSTLLYMPLILFAFLIIFGVCFASHFCIWFLVCAHSPVVTKHKPQRKQ